MAVMETSDSGAVKSLIPYRLDRLPWAKFHWMVVFGLGTAWILDGLEIQLVSVGAFADSLHMSSGEVGFTGTIYLIGEVVGALVFGRITDKVGRRKLFIVTLAIYLVGSGIDGFAMNVWFLWVFRFIAGMGIGGEYTAINSAIDELIPSKYRGRVDLAINGTYWGGAAIGAAASLVLFNDSVIDTNWGWRIAFFIGPVLGLIIVFIRRHIPESPRWMVTHGQGEQAEQIVEGIERDVEEQGHHLQDVPEDKAMWLKPKESIPFRELAHVFFQKYPKRTFLGLTMMITQSFLYNAIFFTYALVLEHFYGISKGNVGYFFFPFAAGNLLGPLLLGHLFDTVGRRKMIFATYGISGLVLLASAFLFHAGALNATTQTIFWCVSFFFASAGASSAYLTVSEIFPLEVRGQAISYFFAIGQVVGAFGPTIFGAMVGNGTDRTPLFWGYVFASAIMLFGGCVALWCGVNAEGKALEDVADPLSKVSGGPENAAAVA
ncbi:MAG: MFS transporter [Marmoricola sp.]